MKLTLTLACSALFCALVGCRTADAANRVEVNLDYVTSLAQDLASRPYKPEARRVPEFLGNLTYDQYRALRFRPEKALWKDAGLPFVVEFFHPGYNFRDAVEIHEFTATHEQRIPFVPEFFDYGQEEDIADRVGASLDYAGFRVRTELNQRGVFDEFVVFLGASYFRAVARDQIYGISARGLGIDTGASIPESFPDFRTFWLGKPQPGDKALRLYGLLDGAHVTGAYEFIITPGKETTVRVRARIILREPVEVLGLAPLSSMFWFGENTLRPPPDWRPEVHDSDGLAILTETGESVWRPLVNPSRTRTEVFAGDRLQGFGLVQRDRRFEAYEDAEAQYHRRPSVWIEPGSGMQAGHLQLLEIATADEYMDNIALVWEPTAHPAPGEVYTYDYVLRVGTATLPEKAAVRATRVGHSLHDEGALELVVDFAGGRLAELAEVEPVEAVVAAPGAEILWQQVQKLPRDDRWRLHLRLRPPPGPDGLLPLEAHLALDGEPLSETWRYQW